MTHTEASVKALREKFPEAVQNIVEFRGQTTVVVDKSAIVDVLRHLKESPPDLSYNCLSALTAVDDWPDEPRFRVVYELYSMKHNARLRLECPIPGDDPNLLTATGVHLNANWHEREVWDLFGIKFAGHPDPRRILLPDDWDGHPLRKDYPLGYEEVQFSFNWQEIDDRKPYAKE